MTTELLRPVTDPKSLSLYPYQAEAIESLRVAARAGHHRIILCAPTGSGKTELAIHLIQEAQRKGSRVTFVVDGISLAEQTSARLASYGIAHGYAQGLNTWGRGERIQVAMAQTIEKREFWTDLNLLIIELLPFRMTTNAEDRFSEPFVSIVEDSQGRVVWKGDLTDEQVAVIEARHAAWRRYYDTGDRGPLVDLGILPESSS